MEAASAYNIAPSSVHRIVHGRRLLGDAPNAQPERAARRRSPITEQVLLTILLLLDEDSTLSLRDIVNILRDVHNVQTSKAAVDRAFNAMQITWKNTCKIPTAWNAPETVELRREYAIWHFMNSNTNSIYIDECSFNIHMYKSKGRALKGTPLFAQNTCMLMF